MISWNIAQVFTWKSESVRVKRGCKFWPWRPCLRAILFQENGTSYRPVHMRMKRYCLVVLKYHKKKFGKSRISAGEIAKLLRQLANPIYLQQICPNNSIGRPNSAQSRPITQSLDWDWDWDFLGFLGLVELDCHQKCARPTCLRLVAMHMLKLYQEHLPMHYWRHYCECGPKTTAKRANVPTEQPF